MAGSTSSAGKVALGVGLVAMWITYPLTSSVGLAWLAFFVVGGMAFAVLAGQRSG